MNRSESFLAYLIDLIDALAGRPRQSHTRSGALATGREPAPVEPDEPGEGDAGDEAGESGEAG